MKKNELIAYWNSYTQKWAENPNNHFSSENNVFKDIRHIKFDPIALPEPYFGDPHCNSAVILNYNPGPVMAEYQLHEKGKFITEAKAHENYYEFAKTFPYLSNYRNTPGGKWWLRRKQWIDRLSSHVAHQDKEQVAKLRPFAFEICPWHSQRFKLQPHQIRTLSDYITNFVLQPAEEIAKGSLLPFIVSVGKDYQTLFEALGFKKEFAIGPENYRQHAVDYPQVKGRAVRRYYSVWRSLSGGIYLNTYSPGSNSSPKAEFMGVERYIVTMICSFAENKQPLAPNTNFVEIPEALSKEELKDNGVDTDTTLTKRAFRQGLIDVVVSAIREMGLKEYIETPSTSAQKSNYDAHLKLSRLGKVKYKTSAANPSKQIIHPDLRVMKITHETCPVNFVNNRKFYEGFAIERLEEFLFELNHSN